MARISLKEQYDNQSVIKQIIDLRERSDEQDAQIEKAVETAENAKATADIANETANRAESRNDEQDGRLDAIDETDIKQNQEIAGMMVKDNEQDGRLDSIESKDREQDASIKAIIAKNDEQDDAIGGIKAKDAEQDMTLSKVLDTDTKQDASIEALRTITNTLTNKVITSVNVTDGTQNGSIMVKLTDEGGRVLASPSYPWGQVAAFELKQGSEPGYVRGVLTLSDGQVIESNDFQILTYIESDVYVTSITLTPYPATGKLGGEIGYSNGNHQQIDIIDVPTAPGVTLNINDLLKRMGVAEGDIDDLDVRVKAIEEIPGIGPFTNTSRGTILGSTQDGKVSACEDGTGIVSGWSDVVKSAQIADMLTKTEADEKYLSKADAAENYETIEDAEQISIVANEAKSTAEDAQTKANGCFNSVALNEADRELVFGTPSGAVSKVQIPKGFEIIDLTKHIKLSASVNSSTYTSSSVYTDYIPIGKEISGATGANVLTYTETKKSLRGSGKVCRYIAFSNFSEALAMELYEKVFTDIPKIENGTATIRVLPAFSKDELFSLGDSFNLNIIEPVPLSTNAINGSTWSFSSDAVALAYTIADGEVTSIGDGSFLGARASFDNALPSKVDKFIVVSVNVTITS